MSDIKKARDSLETRILRGDEPFGPRAETRRVREFVTRRAAKGLTNKVARHACKVTDEDFAGMKAAGLTEEEIFEIVVCAAIGQATRANATVGSRPLRRRRPGRSDHCFCRFSTAATVFARRSSSQLSVRSRATST